MKRKSQSNFVQNLSQIFGSTVSYESLNLLFKFKLKATYVQEKTSSDYSTVNLIVLQL